MKKIAAITVLFVFMLNSMGFYVVFMFNRSMAKKEMITQTRKGVFHPDIVILKILHPESDPRFNRIGNNEFTFSGRLYDIVAERKSGDTTFFFCLRDKKEETLLAGLALFIKSNGRSGTSQKEIPFHALLSNLVFQAITQNSYSVIPDQGVPFPFPDFQTPVIHVFLPPFTPPPKTT